MAGTLNIRIVDTNDDITVCQTLRRTVFIEEQGVSEDLEIDGLDGECTHVLATRDGAPIGTARVRILDDVAKIQRVCVLPKHRAQGIGAAVMRFILTEITTAPSVRTVRLGAQIDALDFYRKLGFMPVGPEYMEAGIPHQDMEISF
jgi:predicted GNAT family N-acyltransferase